MVFERDIPSCSHMVESSSDWRQFSTAVNAAQEPLKPVRHLGKDLPILKVTQLSFPAGKKCNRCQFLFGLVVI